MSVGRQVDVDIGRSCGKEWRSSRWHGLSAKEEYMDGGDCTVKYGARRFKGRGDTEVAGPHKQ
eukprot:12903600-Prorocentrum_lima.AAC.1